MSGATSPIQTVLISAGVTLVVGILSVAGAFVLERFKRSATDRRWLLDRRHDAYVSFLDASIEFSEKLTRARNSGNFAELRDSTFTTTARLRRAEFTLQAVAPDDIQWVAGQIVGASLAQIEATASKNEEAFRTSLDRRGLLQREFVLAVRREVQGRRRFPWAPRIAAMTPWKEPRPGRWVTTPATAAVPDLPPPAHEGTQA